MHLLSWCCNHMWRKGAVVKRKRKFCALLGVSQEDQLDDGWSPVISDYDRITKHESLTGGQGAVACHTPAEDRQGNCTSQGAAKRVLTAHKGTPGS